MKIIKKSNKLLDIIKYLQENPKTLDDELRYPDIRVTLSNFRKQFSEFHRIVVKDKENHISKNIFWIKILKNKPFNEIYKSLSKQYKVMETLWEFFNNQSNIGKGLSCCEPIAVISAFNAHITRECYGKLFNTYLKSNIPLISRRRILEHCYKLGTWLKHFHFCFKNDLACKKELDRLIEEFESKYHLKTWPQLSYITICHNDYGPRNIFVSNNSVEVIDYVGVNYGIPQNDIVFFAKYIFSAKFNFMYHETFKRKMIERFFEGYGIKSINNKITDMVEILKKRELRF